MCFNENFSSKPSFGLPRWDIRIAFPPQEITFLIVGSAARILLLSVILKCSSKGTLKSTRIKTLLPSSETSCMFFILQK